MSKSAIYTVNNTAAEVTDGDTIPLGTIIRRYGQNVRQDGNAITICDKPGCPGYYKVDVIAELEGATADPLEIAVQKDGIDVIGGFATINPGVAGSTLPYPISVMVKNACGGTASLSVKLSGGDAKVINMTTVVEKL